MNTKHGFLPSTRLNSSIPKFSKSTEPLDSAATSLFLLSTYESGSELIELVGIGKKVKVLKYSCPVSGN